ncbi:hypothetical protein B0T26DRAFT_852082 [Lasiosphaeria miniovina]|uniref:PH domain-containing protein n=1 Tax=Lasiosphaeria miniovina TaxID=1954250 RepID=A0AA40AVV1_9PEZI|nr:uncharacterized protein B0T26DRAFT_852082 [Lasiosphaeria miniovina]KAK0722888.1 hypothetical protein B0T26DRAFT_852082 [Lasiosphaeria miniovina]
MPVALGEAALDTPTFRASAVHFADQLDAMERWLDAYMRSSSKLAHDVLALEDTINTYLGKLTLPPANAATLADALLDADYTMLALRRSSDGAREWWGAFLAAARRLEPVGVEPIRLFVNGELRAFKDTRRALDATQKTFDTTLARYVGQSKTKEPSSLREDAFAVFETRKAYLKASLDFCHMAPQLRLSLDKLLVRVCADLHRDITRRSRDTAGTTRGEELERIRGWSKEMEASEPVFRRELQAARRDIGESTLAVWKPSRELEDYSISTVPYLGSRGPVSVQAKDQVAVISEKQGWLFLRVLSGKPVRTTWVRRWYYCRDGIFGWLVQGPQGVLQGDEIGVLLCSAKPAVQEERRFCFEVKTKTQTILLQAETQAQLIEWLEVFEFAKKKAFETSIARDQIATVAGLDPAFTITHPSIPEFSAMSLEGLEEAGSALERAGTLPVPGPDGTVVSRSSFDVGSSAAVARRPLSTLGREEGESGRDHAARIMQKLDLHRKSAFASSSEAISPGGGIANLITASANLLPGYAVSPSPVSGQAPPLRLPNPLAAQAMDNHQGSLAPVTLARPPVSTNLSKAAVLVSAGTGAGRSLPSAVLANYWGSSPWVSMFSTGPAQSRNFSSGDAPFLATSQPRTTSTAATATTLVGLHRKTASVDAKIMDAKSLEKVMADVFPPNYPAALKAQYPQFRLIFPSVPPDEKPVLIFNAAWLSSSGDSRQGQNESMAGNGRIFVTPDNMYFYGHQMGLVISYSINLEAITEVTAAPGKDCDFIYLHLIQDMSESGLSRVTVKVFLEDFNLLYARLNLLVDDLQAEEPMDLSGIVEALVNLDKPQYERRSPSVESWEEVSANTPIDDGTPSGRPVMRRVEDLKYRLSRGGHGKPVPKLQLPAHPVSYEPEGMGKCVAERHFEVSAKACFHVLFGDKSFIFPKLYFERQAKQISQGPWELQDHGRMKRQFRFKVDYVDMLGRPKPGDVTDSQSIDIFNDHITYVVTHIKTPWHLPQSHAFKLVAKVVITHVAKSKCKLAIFTKVDWSKAPAFAKSMVQRQALGDATNDAEELAEVATDQVRKLGPNSRTKRAIQVYGNIGHQTQAVIFTPDTAAEAGKKAMVRPRTLTDMLLETGRSLMESAITSVMMWAFAGLKRIFTVFTAHRVILLLLALSAAYNVVVVSRASSTWWAERRAANYMDRIGVRPNLMMSKAIRLVDLEEAARGASVSLSTPSNSQCYDNFQAIANMTDLDGPYHDAGTAFSSASSKAAARRLQRTRQRLGGYRHDLLVAMRIINGIEVEMLQSEWENWLADENLRCEQVRQMLLRNAANDGGSKPGDGGEQQQQRVLAEEQDGQRTAIPGSGKADDGKAVKRREGLRRWHDDYCGSCEADQRALLTGRTSLVM